MQITIDTDKIKKKFQDNPQQMLLGVGAVLAGLAQLIQANSARKSKNAFVRSVDYRIRNRK